LLLYATTTDYLAVVAMSRSRRKAPWLIVSIVNDLAVLGFFKYAAFFAQNLRNVNVTATKSG
jgi:hypothetical protein